MLKKNAKATIFRTAMVGGGLSYRVLIPTRCVENYDAGRYTTVIREGKPYLNYADATQAEEHYTMPLGHERYEQALSHEARALKEAMTIARRAFPELKHYPSESLPSLWINGLLERETSAKKTLALPNTGNRLPISQPPQGQK